ncbi:L,D-transpeptidase family protein [Sphingomonas donggukensis]|uniref:L,D-transpeptidase family protein n=1 Tax=Sphingomonas donggukensis TaxID=2949093 RepID=A0ABY4TSZ6_9SPHN|nr:L,D-transpeptidase family protein [Sphingomonas donggukensis]URW74950.1 L,D-transpeptidase family protein [Sphingomonas donggukensis]
MSPVTKLWLARAGLALGCVAAFLGAAQVAERVRAQPEAAAAPKPASLAAPAAKPAPASKPVAAPLPADAYTVRSILPIKAPFVHGDWYWDESAAPASAGGRIVVTVDLKAQVLSVFRDGHEIGTAVMIYGADVKPTPLGVFNVSFRKAQHVSSIYNAPMPYTLRLTNDGVSIHGSAVMRPDAATHGCVGVPIPFAKKLFDVVKLGDVVIVSNGETLKQGQAIKAA